jgi:TetR/AcrR family transcriptional regulator
VQLEQDFMRNATSSSAQAKRGRKAAGGRHAHGSVAPTKAMSPKTSSTKAASSKATSSKRARGERAANGSGETRQRILHVATKEFAAKGYDGARVDDIMRDSNVSKNLIYHYFGSKERLFIEVLETAYEGMHAHQTAWPIDISSPVDGVRKLVQSTFNYWRNSPDFIGLLNSENFHKGRHLRKTKLTKAGYSGLLGNIASLLKEGERSGDFRGDVDPVELYVSISALAYHFLSNRYTLAYLLDRKLSTEQDVEARIAHIEDVVLGYLRYGALNSK